MIEMTNSHALSFFGQNSGITISSKEKEEPFLFLKFIKKKKDGSWEKPSQGEGKAIKLSMEEIFMILRLLQKKAKSWSTVHSFNKTKTQISFNWDMTKEKEEEKILWISVGEYKKMLSYAQTEIFCMLLDHLIKEKIEFATIQRESSQKNKFVKNHEEKEEIKAIEDNDTVSAESEQVDIVEEERIWAASNPNDDDKESNFFKKDIMPMNKKSTSEIEGIIKNKTEKAVFIAFNDGKEIWIPKSTIRSPDELSSEKAHKFLIDTWILKKHDLIS